MFNFFIKKIGRKDNMDSGRLLDNFFSTLAGLVFALIIFVLMLALTVFLNKINSENFQKPDNIVQTNIHTTNK